MPSRTVETLLLPFASEVERKVYQDIEVRNTKRFMDLRSDSPKTVLGQYIELNTMIAIVNMFKIYLHFSRTYFIIHSYIFKFEKYLVLIK